ncbi:MAG: FkbM family methyltransferase [Sphaerospermopsis kisseleviana]
MKIIPYLVKRIWIFQKVREFYYWLLKGIPPVSYEPVNSKLLRSLIQKKNPVILEIGCNDGTHTLWFLEIFENPSIYCFEPDPRAVVSFKEKVGNHPNINLYEIALGMSNGKQKFFQSNRTDSDWTCSGSLRKPAQHINLHPNITFPSSIDVSTFTLDTWCSANNIGNAECPIDFIWIDVQGSEIDVIKGGEVALRNTRFLYTEYSDTELYEGQANLQQIKKYLKAIQLVIIERWHSDALFKNVSFRDK